MPLGLLFLASLTLSYLPLSLSYRDGARSESCYNMMVMHTDFLGQIVSPMECGSQCRYRLLLIGRLANCRLTPMETTYQCGETYRLRLISSDTTATFEGFMVEARESSEFFGEGSTIHQEDFDNASTIWGTWVTDPNQVGSGYSPDDFLYHAIECNRSLDSNEGPFENAATQNSPADLRSVDLYWRAPPPPNSSEEYLQLPQQIQFWFVAVQQRLTYYYPVPGPRLDRDCIDPIATPIPTPTTTLTTTATSIPTTTAIPTPTPTPISTATATRTTTVIPTPTQISTESPTSSAGISLGQIAAIIIGSIYSGFGALLILTVLLLFTLLCYKSYKHYRGAELSYTLSSLDTSYWIHNEYAEEENSVPNKKLMFADRESSSPDPLTGRSDNDLQEIVTAL